MIIIVDAPAVGAEISEVRPGALEWAAEIIIYLDAKEKWEARKVKRRVAHFTLVDGVLYQWSYLETLLRCISPGKI